MAKENIEDILSGVSTALKKELLDNLLSSLLRDPHDAEKNEVLGAVLASRESSGQVLDMVER
jgi:hypothetical protein